MSAYRVRRPRVMAPKFTRSLEYSARCPQPEKQVAANQKSADIEEGVPAKRGFEGVPNHSELEPSGDVPHGLGGAAEVGCVRCAGGRVDGLPPPVALPLP